MSARTEPVDPDFHLHTAWLAQVSEPAGAPVNKQAPSQGGSSTSASTSSLELVDRVVEQDERRIRKSSENAGRKLNAYRTGTSRECLELTARDCAPSFGSMSVLRRPLLLAFIEVGLGRCS